tara:strand:+ start:787 stop:906 length:120 start_codon:yes stop_codon:yes gene_type:complete
MKQIHTETANIQADVPLTPREVKKIPGVTRGSQCAQLST